MAAPWRRRFCFCRSEGSCSVCLQPSPGELGQAGRGQRRPGGAPPQGLRTAACSLISSPPPSLETEVMRMLHFAFYIWNLDALKATFLCPSQNVQMNALRRDNETLQNPNEKDTTSSMRKGQKTGNKATRTEPNQTKPLSQNKRTAAASRLHTRRASPFLSRQRGGGL